MSLSELNQCLKQQQFSQALEHCDTLISEGDNSAALQAVKGWSLYKTGQMDTGWELLSGAFDREPFNEQVMSMTLSFLMETANYHKVAEYCQRSAAFHMGSQLLWHRFATAHYLLGDYDASVMAFRRALRIKSDAVASQFGISMPLLQQGNYREGFSFYENRFKPYPHLDWLKSHKLPMPRWNGESLKDKAILLWSEQGLGDSIQFFRFATTLVEMGAYVDVMLQAAHASLAAVLASIKGIGKVIVIPGNTVSLYRRYDYHSAVMSVMHHIGLERDTMPQFGQYISPPTQHQLVWENYLSNVSGRLKVGIVWSTKLTDNLRKQNAMHYFEKNKKNVPLDDIQPILNVDNICYFSLHAFISEQDRQVFAGNSVIDMSPVIGSFADTAAIIDKMDVVISIDTSVAHLAGAMGKPTINLLPYVSDWRWQEHREDTPWYPSMRLLQQVWRSDWKATMKRLEILMSKLASDYQQGKDINIFQ